jgi:hypothetical protein
MEAMKSCHILTRISGHPNAHYNEIICMCPWQYCSATYYSELQTNIIQWDTHSVICVRELVGY